MPGEQSGASNENLGPAGRAETEPVAGMAQKPHQSQNEAERRSRDEATPGMPGARRRTKGAARKAEAGQGWRRA